MTKISSTFLVGLSALFTAAGLTIFTSNLARADRVCLDYSFSERFGLTGISTDLVLKAYGHIVDHVLDVAVHGKFARGNAEVTDINGNDVRVHYWAEPGTKLNWHLVVYCS